MILPEKLFINLEKDIVKKYGKKGEQILYSIGKKFGYRYASLSKFLTIKKTSEKEFLKFLYMFVRYAESTSYGKLKHKINLKSKIWNFYMKDYMICPHNGIGLIYSAGGAAGIVSFMMDDPRIEGVQIKCQGRGDKECEVIFALPEYFRSKKIDFFVEKNLIPSSSEKNLYKMNYIRQTKYAMKSFKDLIDSGLFKFKKGIIERNNLRYFFQNLVLFIL